MKPNLYIPVFFALLISVISCNSRKSDIQSIEEMKFNVSDSLLNNEYVILDKYIKFKNPVDWKENNDLINALQKSLIEKNPYSLSLQKCFLDSVTNAVLLVSSIDNMTDDYYKSMISRSLSAEQTEFQNFCIYYSNGIKIDQFFSRDNNNVSFKLIIFDENKSKIQLDYILPINKYQLLSRKVESSIGSIISINH
jgi:hypothetical protein